MHFIYIFCVVFYGPQSVIPTDFDEPLIPTLVPSQGFAFLIANNGLNLPSYLVVP